MNYLQIVRQASGELGLAVPQQVAGNNAMDVIQIGALASGLGQSMARDFDWQALQREYRFMSEVYPSACVTTTGNAVVTGIASTASLAADDWMAMGTGILQDTYIFSVDSATQVTLTRPVSEPATQITFARTKYDLPADCKRITGRTQWDASAHWAMVGPVNPTEWQTLKAGISVSGIRRYFRLMEGKFQIFPPSADALYLGFEYLSRSWVRDAAGVAKESFTNDTDTCIFDDRLMVSGLKVAYFAAKGFDTTVMAGEFNRLYDNETGSDKIPGMLSLGVSRRSNLIGYGNVADTGYGRSP